MTKAQKEYRKRCAAKKEIISIGEKSSKTFG
jgi:hypothetical protein